MKRSRPCLLAVPLLLLGCSNATHGRSPDASWLIEGSYVVEYEVQPAPNQRAKRTIEDVARLRFDTNCVVLETASGEGQLLPLQRLHGLVWKPVE